MKNKSLEKVVDEMIIEALEILLRKYKLVSNQRSALGIFLLINEFLDMDKSKVQDIMNKIDKNIEEVASKYLEHNKLVARDLTGRMKKAEEIFVINLTYLRLNFDCEIAAIDSILNANLNNALHGKKSFNKKWTNFFRNKKNKELYVKAVSKVLRLYHIYYGKLKEHLVIKEDNYTLDLREEDWKKVSKEFAEVFSEDIQIHSFENLAEMAFELISKCLIFKDSDIFVSKKLHLNQEMKEPEIKRAVEYEREVYNEIISTYPENSMQRYWKLKELEDENVFCADALGSSYEHTTILHNSLTGDEFIIPANQLKAEELYKKSITKYYSVNHACYSLANMYFKKQLPAENEEKRYQEAEKYCLMCSKDYSPAMNCLANVKYARAIMILEKEGFSSRFMDEIYLYINYIVAAVLKNNIFAEHNLRCFLYNAESRISLYREKILKHLDIEKISSDFELACQIASKQEDSIYI